MRDYQLFHISVRGAEHSDNQALSEEYSQICEEKEAKIAAVASLGEGSPYFRSHLGARFAVESAMEMARAFVRDIRPEELFESPEGQERILRQLEGSIIVGWQERVKEHLERSPMKEEEIEAIGNDPALEKYKKCLPGWENLEYAVSQCCSCCSGRSFSPYAEKWKCQLCAAEKEWG